MIDDSIRYDRNIRLFGADGQNRIKAARVGVAGLGGLGCRLVQHLAYLGVTRYVLVDADRTGSHSLNRLVTAHPDDVGQYKTDLAERLIRSINPQAEVINIRHHVPHPDAVDALAELALILGGLDMPLIVHWGMNHFMVVERIRESGVDIVDPNAGRRQITHEEFAAEFTGIALELTPTDRLKSGARDWDSGSSSGRSCRVARRWSARRRPPARRARRCSAAAATSYQDETTAGADPTSTPGPVRGVHLSVYRDLVVAAEAPRPCAGDDQRG